MFKLNDCWMAKTDRKSIPRNPRPMEQHTGLLAKAKFPALIFTEHLRGADQLRYRLPVLHTPIGDVVLQRLGTDIQRQSGLKLGSLASSELS